MHDRNGNPLKVGDRVTLRATILELSTTPDMCNCKVEVERTDEGSVDQTFWLNTRQTELRGERQEIEPGQIGSLEDVLGNPTEIEP